METLLQTRYRLLTARSQTQVMIASFAYGMNGNGVPMMVPPEYSEQLLRINQELEVVDQALLRALLGIVEKLPKCVECEDTASHQIKEGPYFCRAHAAEHPTARQVPWYEELRRLGLVSSQ